MSKTVEIIEINSTGIEVKLKTDKPGVGEVIPLKLKTQENEIDNIFQKFGLETGVRYNYDEKIIRALATTEEKEQLVDYLEVCRKSSYPSKRVDIPDTIPEITYDLRGLKDSFPEIEDEVLRKAEQIQIYNDARNVCNMLREKTILKVGLSDKIYIMVAKFKQPKIGKDKPLLGDGNTNIEENIEEKENNRKSEFKDSIKVESSVTEKTVDKASKEHIEQLDENTVGKENEEKENSSDNEIAI